MVLGRVTFNCCPPAGKRGNLPDQSCKCPSLWQANGGVYSQPVDCGKLGSCSRGRCPPAPFPGTLSASRIDVPGGPTVGKAAGSAVSKVVLVPVDGPALWSAREGDSRRRGGGSQHLRLAASNAAARCINARKVCRSNKCKPENQCPQKHKRKGKDKCSVPCAEQSCCYEKNYSYSIHEYLTRLGVTYEQRALEPRPYVPTTLEECCTRCELRDDNVVRRNNTPFKTVAGVPASLFIDSVKLNANLREGLGGQCESDWVKYPTMLNVLGLQRAAFVSSQPH